MRHSPRTLSLCVLSLSLAAPAARAQRPSATRFDTLAVFGQPAELRADLTTAIGAATGDERVTYRVRRALVALYEGRRERALLELDAIADSIPSLGVGDTIAAAVAVRRAQAVLELNGGELDAATRAVSRLTPLLRASVASDSDGARASQVESEVALFEGWLAARRGDFFDARVKARTMIAAVAQSRDPRRNEGSEQLLGLLELLQGNARYAEHHFAKADPDDPWVMFHRAVALERTGRISDARALYRSVAAHPALSAWSEAVRDSARAKSR